MSVRREQLFNDGKIIGLIDEETFFIGKTMAEHWLINRNGTDENWIDPVTRQQKLSKLQAADVTHFKIRHNNDNINISAYKNCHGALGISHTYSFDASALGIIHRRLDRSRRIVDAVHDKAGIFCGSHDLY